MKDDVFIFKTRIYPTKDAASYEFRNESHYGISGEKFPEKNTVKGGVMFFLGNTTAHGFGHIYTAITGKRFKLAILFSAITVFFMILAGSMAVQTTISAFFSGTTQSTIKINLPNGGKFPKLVLCNSGILNVSAAQDLGLDQELRAYLMASQIGVYGVVPEFAQNFTRRKQLYERFIQFLEDYGKGINSLIYDTGWKCENLILQCTYGPAIINGSYCCQTLFKPVLTFYGLCYEASMEKVQHQFIEGHAHGYRILLRVTPDMEKGDLEYDITYPLLVPSTGVIAAVMNNITSASKGILADAIYVKRGLQTDVALEYLVVDNILSTSGVWQWSKPTCIKLDAPHEELAYIRSNCLIDSMREFMEADNCTNIVYATDDQRPCTIEDYLALDLSTDFASFSVAVYDTIYCKPACIEETFKTRVKMTTLNWNVDDDDVAVLNLFYPSFMYTEVVQSRPSLADWISSLGGQIGIFLGASIITCFEFTLFILNLVFGSMKLFFKRIYKK